MRAREFITEVFNTPYELITDTPQTNFVRDSIRHNGHGLNGLMVYQIKDDPSNIFFQVFENGYWEVHHIYDNGLAYKSGEILNYSNKPNVKFFSTILKLYMNRLNKGHSIRIVARNKDQWETYSKVIQYILNKYPDDYIASDIDYNYIDLQGYKSISQSINARGKEWITKPLNEARKMLKVNNHESI